MLDISNAPEAKWTSQSLAMAVIGVMQDVLVHQRSRWAALFAHQHQYEGWWKAEFALALESWCWRLDLPELTWIVSEAKPKDHGIGESRESVDILVGRWIDDSRPICADSPRVWIEIKERGTWWGGGAKKAFGEANRGLESDLNKWAGHVWKPTDVVVACQIISHDSDVDPQQPLPESWHHELDEIDRRHPRFVRSRSVCCPSICPSSGRPVHRFATIEFFKIAAPFGSHCESMTANRLLASE